MFGFPPQSAKYYCETAIKEERDRVEKKRVEQVREKEKVFGIELKEFDTKTQKFKCTM